MAKVGFAVFILEIAPSALGRELGVAIQKRRPSLPQVPDGPPAAAPVAHLTVAMR